MTFDEVEGLRGEVVYFHIDKNSNYKPAIGTINSYECIYYEDYYEDEDEEITDSTEYFSFFKSNEKDYDGDRPDFIKEILGEYYWRLNDKVFFEKYITVKKATKISNNKEKAEVTA